MAGVGPTAPVGYTAAAPELPPVHAYNTQGVLHRPSYIRGDGRLSIRLGDCDRNDLSRPLGWRWVARRRRMRYRGVRVTD